MKIGFVILGSNVLESFLALSDREQSQGLMHVVPPTPIMSFVYTYPKVNKFWMQNTPSDLDIVFCYKNKVSQIHQGKPFSTTSIGYDELSDLVVELPLGACEKMGIKIGSSAKIIK